MYNNKPPFSKHPPLSTFQSTHVDSNLHTLFQSSYSLCNFYFLISQDSSLFKPFNCNLLVFFRSCSHWNLIWINKTIKSNTTLIQMSNQPKKKLSLDSLRFKAFMLDEWEVHSYAILLCCHLVDPKSTMQSEEQAWAKLTKLERATLICAIRLPHVNLSTLQIVLKFITTVRIVMRFFFLLWLLYKWVSFILNSYDSISTQDHLHG